MSTERRLGHYQRHKRTIKVQRTKARHSAHIGSRWDRARDRDARLILAMRRQRGIEEDFGGPD